MKPETKEFICWTAILSVFICGYIAFYHIYGLPSDLHMLCDKLGICSR